MSPDHPTYKLPLARTSIMDARVSHPRGGGTDGVIFRQATRHMLCIRKDLLLCIPNGPHASILTYTVRAATPAKSGKVFAPPGSSPPHKKAVCLTFSWKRGKGSEMRLACLILTLEGQRLALLKFKCSCSFHHFIPAVLFCFFLIPTGTCQFHVAGAEGFHRK